MGGHALNLDGGELEEAQLTMDSEPFVEVLAFRKFHRKTKISGTLWKISLLCKTSHIRERTRVASAYFLSWYCFVPSGTSLRGLKVRVLPLSK
jgi:hypothetical protein